MKKAPYRLTKVLLVIGALFFASEFLLHFFGLPILEHDKIFLPTHDRYIALFGLSKAFMLGIAATDVKKYRIVFVGSMAIIFLAMLNAFFIMKTGGYTQYFEVKSLDADLGLLGWSFLAWYLATWAVWYKKK